MRADINDGQPAVTIALRTISYVCPPPPNTHHVTLFIPESPIEPWTKSQGKNRDKHYTYLKATLSLIGHMATWFLHVSSLINIIDMINVNTNWVYANVSVTRVRHLFTIDSQSQTQLKPFCREKYESLFAGWLIRI